MAEKVSLTMVKELRERTGLGMAKCKRALEEANGDIDAALKSLNKQGIATAAKKEGREANEGMIASAESNTALSLVEVSAETDFVVKNEQFRSFVQDIAEEVASTSPSSLEEFMQQKLSKNPEQTIEEYRASMVATIGENIQVRRILVIPKTAESSFGVYSHLGGKIVSTVEIAGANDEEALARSIAIHAAAMAPQFMKPEEIPAEIIEKEREAASEVASKAPPAHVDKIIDAKLNIFYNGICLLRQPFVQDEDVTVAELVEKQAKDTGKTLELKGFTRWAAGQV
ncbi:MAG: elongation factor Ts [Waddliaceae bacterium]|nr:elongation factor Ts [Waddliaceae bacterium]